MSTQNRATDAFAVAAAVWCTAAFAVILDARTQHPALQYLGFAAICAVFLFVLRAASRYAALPDPPPPRRSGWDADAAFALAPPLAEGVIVRGVRVLLTAFVGAGMGLSFTAWAVEATG